MIKKKTVILVILLPLPVIFILFNIIGYSYNFIVKQKTIPSYNQPTSPLNLFSICEKIEDKETQTFCFALIRNDFSLLGSSICENDFFFNNYDKDFCYCYLKQQPVKKCYSNNEFDFANDFCKEYSNKPSCLALTKNPYHCEREAEFMDSAEKDMCYRYSAIKWEDPSLCDKIIYNEDACYFYLVVEEIKKRGK